jgi:hypothetical protein
MMRTTLTLDPDVATLLAKENRASGEPMKRTVNRLLRRGLSNAATPGRAKRFIVKPLQTGLSAAQWAKWDGRKVEEIIDDADGR